MNITRDYSRLDKFLTTRQGDVGATFFDFAHINVSEAVINLLDNMGLIRGKQILDIGCGTGRDLVRFINLGGYPQGVTINVHDALLRQRMRKHNLVVHEMDQNFINLPAESFDLVFARHVLEHSVIPFFTLTEYNRLLKLNGVAYIEVPAPIDRPNAHPRWLAWPSEDNENHYSVLGKDMWLSLFKRAGFEVIQSGEMTFNAPDEEQPEKLCELWFGFYLRKASDPLEPTCQKEHGLATYVHNAYDQEEPLENENT